MRYSLSLAPHTLLALALMLCLTEQHHGRIDAAAPAPRSPIVAGKSGGGEGQRGQTRKASSRASAPAQQARPVVVVHEIDLAALQKLLQREPGKDARPILVSFWATWCEPCREEFPDLVRIKADYERRNLDFITVSLDDPAEIKTTVPAFLREMRAPMPAYLLNVIEPQTTIDAIDPEWGGGLPATFLFDADGKIVFKHTGRVNAEELRTAIDKVTTSK
jgi:thiol-disulfide isomerase/thioredoxin